MHIAIITAGGAGMFCGSCMHDNAWARGLIAAGQEVSLVPTYTPVRLDEPSAVNQRVFFGGVNVYLDSKSHLWRALPKSLKAWLDHPGLLNLVSRLSTRNDASQLGDLTLGMLQGEAGPNRQAVEELAMFLAKDLRPDVVIFSNVLLSGAVRRLKDFFPGPVLATLQGDDVFLDALSPSYRERAVALIAERAGELDGYFVHSTFYRDYISRYLRLPVEKFAVLPLSIDPAEHTGQPAESTDRPFTIGYFARLAPEKGLHNLVQAVELLRQRKPEVRLRVGGYLGQQNEEYFQSLQQQTADWGSGFEYVGSPDSLAEKTAFYQSCDVLSVPTDFLEPKGLYVLEALANGVPVVQPAHGSFPELIQSTGGGWLVPPRNPQALADQLERVMNDRDERLKVARLGHQRVRERHSPAALAAATASVLKRVMDRNVGAS